MRDKQDEKRIALTGECSRDVERCLTKRAALPQLILRPSPAPFLISKSMLTDVGPVELWATP